MGICATSTLMRPSQKRERPTFGIAEKTSTRLVRDRVGKNILKEINSCVTVLTGSRRKLFPRANLPTAIKTDLLSSQPIVCLFSFHLQKVNIPVIWKYDPQVVFFSSLPKLQNAWGPRRQRDMLTSFLASLPHHSHQTLVWRTCSLVPGNCNSSTGKWPVSFVNEAVLTSFACERADRNQRVRRTRNWRDIQSRFWSDRETSSKRGTIYERPSPGWIVHESHIPFPTLWSLLLFLRSHWIRGARTDEWWAREKEKELSWSLQAGRQREGHSRSIYAPLGTP